MNGFLVTVLIKWHSKKDVLFDCSILNPSSLAHVGYLAADINSRHILWIIEHFPNYRL